jgi:hypothetical protein
VGVGRMKKIKYEDMARIAKPGDILLGRFLIAGFSELNIVVPIVLIGECIGCTVDKSNVKAGATTYIQKLKGGIYESFEIDRNAANDNNTDKQGAL